ncbi:MAG: hypothetical protein KC620_25625, partial [Myxococcales bacterium]|nr:hypothetical protein [Myxococcales bacterium]
MEPAVWWLIDPRGAFAVVRELVDGAALRATGSLDVRPPEASCVLIAADLPEGLAALRATAMMPDMPTVALLEAATPDAVEAALAAGADEWIDRAHLDRSTLRAT